MEKTNLLLVVVKQGPNSNCYDDTTTSSSDSQTEQPEIDALDEWEKLYGDYYPDDQIAMAMADYRDEILKSKVKDSPLVIQDRSLRAIPAKYRPKFNAQWNGMSNTFRVFQRDLEGHLLQVGAGYMIQESFIDKYKELKTDY